MPTSRALVTMDEAIVRAPVADVFAVVRDVERWPDLLPHYRYVKFRSRNRDGGGIVEMSANRPFGPLNWPTWWLSYMSVDDAAPSIRFRHVEGITTGMEVEWAFTPHETGTHIRLFHVWDGPDWPFVGPPLAVGIIGPVFIHGIASRTVAGLAATAEQRAGERENE
ncbi:MAG TPA: SRPBCC family protein [Gemmatimonadaceae bacterium]|nr:SRPBCC family protein [Gemmatimonadaceae bacterium]